VTSWFRGNLVAKTLRAPPVRLFRLTAVYSTLLPCMEAGRPATMHFITPLRASLTRCLSAVTRTVAGSLQNLLCCMPSAKDLLHQTAWASYYLPTSACSLPLLHCCLPSVWDCTSGRSWATGHAVHAASRFLPLQAAMEEQAAGGFGACAGSGANSACIPGAVAAPASDADVA